jgi:hypothetical protein
MAIYMQSLTREERVLELGKLRGAFEMGHTTYDVDLVLEEVERLTGLTCRVVWAFEDMWGTGGDSELFCYKEATHTLWQVPEALNDYLYNPETQVAPDDLLTLTPGAYIGRAPRHGSDYNLVRRCALHKELG